MQALAVALVLLHGVVMRGPTKPVCDMATPCSEPAAHTALVFVRSGAAPVRTRTDAKGRYTVHLRPGRYVVRLTVRLQRLQPALLVVRRSKRVDFQIDTGIR